MRHLTILLFAMTIVLCASARAATTTEAESAQLGSDTKVIANADASGGKCVLLGANGGGTVEKPDVSKPSITFEFSLDAPERVTIETRVLTPNTGTDSWYFSIDDAAPVIARPKAGPDWHLYLLSRRALEAGKHTVRLYTREVGAMVDWLRVSDKGYGKDVVERYPAPPIVPPADVHPRVLMYAKDIAEIKARRTEGENAEAWKVVQEQAANDTISGKLPDEKTGPFGNYDRNVLHVIRSKAFVYVMDGDEKRGREAVALMMDFLRTIKFVHAKELTRRVGRVFYVGGLVYDWCYPLLTDAQRKEMIARLETVGEEMEIKYPPYGQGAVTGHGGEAQLLQDVLTASVAVYDEYPDMYRMAAGRIFAEFIPARDFPHVSGRHHQGTGYGPFRFQWEMYTAWLYRLMSDTDIYSKAMQDLPYHWIYARRPDGKLLRDGDYNATGDDYRRFPYGLMLVSNYYRDPILKGEFLRQTDGKAFLGGGYFYDPELFLIANDPSIPTKSPDGLPLTRFRGGPLPSMMCRTGWGLGYASPAVVTDFKGASYQFNNHHHLDAGSFQIYYKGALALDTGAYPWYGGDYDFGYNKRSISHNMMLVHDPDEKMTKDINDGGMRHPNNGREPRTLEVVKDLGYEIGSTPAHAFGPNPDAPLYSYMRVVLDRAYSEKVRAYTRSFCFLNLNDPNRPAAVIVYDDMTTARGDLKKIWVMHALEKPAVDGNTIDVRRTESGYNGRLAISALLPEKPAIELIEDKDGKVDVFGKTLEINSTAPECSGWRIQVSPSLPSEHDELLHVMQVMDADGAEPLKTKKLESDGLLGVSLGDRTVWFVRGADPLKRVAEIEVPEAGQVLVAGLRPGHWTLEAPKGKSFTAYEVADGNGTLFFVAERAGCYRLSPFVDGRAVAAPDLEGMKPEVRESHASILVDGKDLAFTEPFERENGAALIPLRKTLGLAGVRAKVRRGTLTAEYEGRTLTVKAGESSYMIGGRSFPMAAEARKTKGDLLAPARPVAGLLRRPFADSAALGDVRFLTPSAAAAKSYWIEGVSVEGPPSKDSPEYAVDDNLSTKWTCEGSSVNLVLDLGKVVPVSRVGEAWYQGARRKAFFSIEVSKDGKKWDRVWDGQSSGTTADLQIQEFDKRMARYVRLVCRGNSSNNWNSICEVKVLKD